jgi:hypothetical protein
VSRRILIRRLAGGVGAAVLLGLGLWFALRRGPEEKASSQRNEVHEVAPVAATDPATAEPKDEPAPAPLTRPKTDTNRPPFASEEDYLRTLDELNRTDKRRALELVRKGDDWYSSSGVNAEARQAMGITLLVDLGRMDEARARTRRFIAEHPTSRYRPLVQGVTGIHPRPTGPGPESR